MSDLSEPRLISSFNKTLFTPFIMSKCISPYLSDQDIFRFASCSKFTFNTFEHQFYSFNDKMFSNTELHSSYFVPKPILKLMKKNNVNLVNLVFMLKENDKRINLCKFIPLSVRILKIWTSNFFYYRKLNLYSLTNLQYLEIPINYNKPIKSFPPNLVVLKFDPRSTFNKPIHDLPSSLRWLNLGNNFNNKITFNEGLEYVSFGKKFNKKMILPSSLIYLEFCHNLAVYNINSERCNNLSEIRINADDDSQYADSTNQLLSIFINQHKQSLVNIMIGDLFYTHKVRTRDNDDKIRIRHSFMNKLISLSTEEINSNLIRNNRIPFVLSKQYGIFQCFGKYRSIEHLFSTEIQLFIQNEIIKSNFKLNYDFITNTFYSKSLMTENRLLIETFIYVHNLKKMRICFSISD